MGRRHRDREFWESALKNNFNWRQYYFRLMELSMSMFEWKNLPDTIDERFMEFILFSQGKAVFFEDKDIGFLCLRCATGGGFNVYHIPIDRRVIADNGYTKDLNIKNSVLIYNNLLHTNSVADVELFSYRLYDLDRIIEVNARAQKTPVLLKCSENERQSVLNAYKEFDGNAPVIYGDKQMSKDAITSLTTGAPYVADKLYTLKTQIWNEALTYLGISNVNITKKERLLNDEVHRNQGGTIASRYSRLESRKRACREINRMFGLNIDVEYREDTRVMDDYMIDTIDKGGDDNE